MQRFGQHFLRDRAALGKIAATLEPAAGERIVEIGAGHGELTDELRKKGWGVRIVAIEKDRTLAGELKERFEREAAVEIVEGDALRIIPALAASTRKAGVPYRLVGNIPYYLTGRLLRTVGELPHKPVSCVFTVQREVAERIAAKPPRMNRLAASVGFWAEPKILFAIPSSAFRPPPKVESIVIRLTARDMKDAAEQEAYHRLVRALFQQPRKTIMNNLIPYVKRGVAREDIETALVKISVKPDARPQNLSLDDLTRMSEALSPLLGGRGRGQPPRP